MSGRHFWFEGDSSFGPNWAADRQPRIELVITSNVETRMISLGLNLPEAPHPQGSYVPAVRYGDLCYLSGVLPMEDGTLVFPGIVGQDVSVEDAQQAARICVVNLLANLKVEIGSLDRVARIIRLGGFVASTPSFTAHPEVVNSASDLLREIFGEAGRHARAAVGVSSLPRNSCVEIDAIVALTL